MRNKKSSLGLLAAAMIAVTVFGAATRAACQTEKLLHSFGSGSDGSAPNAGVIFDSKGNLYGQTTSGGAYLTGTIFELIPRAGGGWAEKILYNFDQFTSDGTQPGGGVAPDGCYPWGGVITDASGNLYGTTAACGASGLGIVFEFTPKTGGTWTEKILHAFGGLDGANPLASLIFDPSGNLYGTTSIGGAYGFGTVFELTPRAGGGWSEKVLYSFANGADGGGPVASVILDASGNLYGTAPTGGAYGFGTVFELTPSAGGTWTEKVLHSFGNSTDGTSPQASLAFDAAGNLYGTASAGGAFGEGAVFKLVPGTGGSWTETLLYSFLNNRKDGVGPVAGVTFDAAGNLYGTTHNGGAYGAESQYAGTVFEITP